jgi:K(+)-stimulated pyrophosphate-energized sodium pump
MSGKRLFVSMAALVAMATPLWAQEQAEAVSGITKAWWIAPFGALFGLFFAWVCYRLMMKAPKGNARMEEIAGYVREGAMAYLKQQYTRVGLVFIVLVAIFAFLAFMGWQNPFVPVAFLTGGFFSGLCGFIGMKTATSASSRTAQGASESLNRGLQVAFRSGAVMGLVVVGFGLLDICIWYWILDQFVYTPEHMQNGLSVFGVPLVHAGCSMQEKMVEITTTMLTFGMGASTQALFARVGGGIYTKAADVGADLVGKVEAGIPEDDPRNPATIADNVGDNVGDVAGMGADLYDGPGAGQHGRRAHDHRGDRHSAVRGGHLRGPVQGRRKHDDPAEGAAPWHMGQFRPDHSRRGRNGLAGHHHVGCFRRNYCRSACGCDNRLLHRAVHF